MTGSDESKAYLYLIRHAQSANNAQDETLRVCDPSITELGWNQAETMGRWLQDTPFQSLVTSGFRRALQTASRIQKYSDLVPEIVVDMHEHGGCFDGWHEDNFAGKPGMTADQIRAEFGTVQIPNDYPETGWWESKPRETHDGSNRRADKMSTYWKKRLSQASGNIVCVTHADFLAKLLLAMFGSNICENERYHDLKNVGITIVGLEESTWKLYQLNSVEFLAEELISS